MIATEHQFITDFALYANPTDTPVHPRSGVVQLTLRALCQDHGGRLRVRVGENPFMGRTRHGCLCENTTTSIRSKGYALHPNPFHPASPYYNKRKTITCALMGPCIEAYRNKRDVTAGGFVTSDRYRAEHCEGCPLRGSCFKAKGTGSSKSTISCRNTSKRQGNSLGGRHQAPGLRCIEPEAVLDR